MQLRMYCKNQKYPRNALRKHPIFPGMITAYHSFLILCYLIYKTGFNLTEKRYICYPKVMFSTNGRDSI